MVAGVSPEGSTGFRPPTLEKSVIALRVEGELALAHLDLKPEIVVDSGKSTGAANWVDTTGNSSPCETPASFPVFPRHAQRR